MATDRMDPPKLVRYSKSSDALTQQSKIMSYSHLLVLVAAKIQSGSWGFPKTEEDKKEVKQVKRTVKKKAAAAEEPPKEKHCGPWGVHSVHELEDCMGLE